MKDYVTVTAERLRAACIPLFEGLGTPRDEAEVVVDVHVDSDLRGEESHGVRMLDIHLKRIKAGGNLAQARVTVVKDRHAVALLDAHHSLGQVVAARPNTLTADSKGLAGVDHTGGQLPTRPPPRAQRRLAPTSVKVLPSLRSTSR